VVSGLDVVNWVISDSDEIESIVVKLAFVVVDIVCLGEAVTVLLLWWSYT
jgi:hypothetical protein